MLKKGQIIFILLFGVIFLVSAGVFDRIQKLLEKRDFEKVEKLARKSLEKDTLNPGAKFYMSILFFEEDYTLFNIDSAIFHIRSAESDYKRASKEILEDLYESKIDTFTLNTLRVAITDYAFKKALDEISITSLEEFMRKYPESEKVSIAIAKRDSIAFQQASAVNTWQSYQQFYRTYPEADQVSEARRLYDQLIYEDMTRDDQLESYIDFLNQFPKTPYRREVETTIFRKCTLDNSQEKYFSFIREYPKSHLAVRAGDILYHQLKHDPNQLKKLFEVHPKADSLRILDRKQAEIVLPVLKEEKMGFMTTSGALQIDLIFSDVSREYNCGNIQSDWLEVSDQNNAPLIVNRNGQKITENATGADQVSESIWLVKNQGQLYHTSGFLISGLNVSDAEELVNGWIAYQKDYNWGVMALTGEVILPAEYTSVISRGSFVILEKDDKFGVTNANHLMTSSIPEIVFDDFEFIGDTLLQVFDGSNEGLIDADLKELVALGEHEIFSKKGFLYTRDSLGYQFVLRDKESRQKRFFKQLSIEDGWLALRPDSTWIIRSNKLDTVFTCDSLISLSPDFVAATKATQPFVLWQNGKLIKLNNDFRLTLITSSGSGSRFLDIYIEGDHQVFDQNGNELFKEKCDEITLLADSLFRIKRGTKSGLINRLGDKVLDLNYDAVNREDELIFTLREGKIGTYDILEGISIPASYESRIKKVATFYKVKSGGKFGLVDRENQFVFEPEYDEILAWNDTSMWVNQGDYWSLQTINQEVIMTEIQSVTPWFEHLGDMIYTFMTEDGMGLLNAKKGILVEAKYNEIINLGTDDQPVFFAEQVLKTAEFYVVTYFDGLGSNIRSQAFRPDEYERIYCDQ